MELSFHNLSLVRSSSFKLLETIEAVVSSLKSRNTYTAYQGTDEDSISIVMEYL